MRFGTFPRFPDHGHHLEPDGTGNDPERRRHRLISEHHQLRARKTRLQEQLERPLARAGRGHKKATFVRRGELGLLPTHRMRGRRSTERKGVLDNGPPRARSSDPSHE